MFSYIEDIEEDDTISVSYTKNIIIACFVFHNFIRKDEVSTSINNMNTNTFRNNNVYLDDNKDEVVTQGTTTDNVNV